MSYKIGIDSGGTHITATAYKNKKEIVTFTTGPGNIFLNPTQTVSNLIKVIREIVTSFPNDSCDLILIGIAGLESAANPAPYLEQIQNAVKNFTQNIIFVSDAKLALINCLKGKDGFLAIAGTGSIVYGKQANKYLRAGGWGFLLDDVGSGYKIAQEAVTIALQHMDSGEYSSLTPLILKYFEKDNLKEVVSKYYQLNRTEIAAFSKKIADAAEKGNSEAISIIKHQGILLGNQIICLISRFSMNNISLTLALSGSVLVNNKIIQQEIINKVKSKYPSIDIIISDQSNTAAVNYM